MRPLKNDPPSKFLFMPCKKCNDGANAKHELMDSMDTKTILNGCLTLYAYRCHPCGNIQYMSKSF